MLIHKGFQICSVISLTSVLGTFFLTLTSNCERIVHCRRLLCQLWCKPDLLPLWAQRCLWMSSFWGVKVWTTERWCFDSLEEFSLKTNSVESLSNSSVFSFTLQVLNWKACFCWKKIPTEKKASLFRSPWFHTNIEKIIFFKAPV